MIIDLFFKTVVFCVLSSAFPVGLLGGEPHQKRFIYNSDGGNMYDDAVPPMRAEDVYKYVDEVAGRGVTTFFACPNFGMEMNYPSQVADMIGSWASAEQNEKIKEVAPKKKDSSARAITNLRGLVKAGHDPFGLVIDRARAKGFETFVTFRLNEIHDVQNKDSLIVSRFWRDHPDWRVGYHGDEILPLYKEIIGGNPKHRVHPIVASWFPGALNFAIPQVRARRLAELRECCERYPIDGLDLDFQRFPIYFPQDKGREYIETMTGWVRQVREMTREVGKKRGRPLLLSARILAKPEQNLGIGLDPFTWAKEKLVDFVIVSHYLRNDFALPIAEFRKRIPNIPIYASIEVEQKADGFRRIAKQLYADGVDGIMLFNFFTWREGGREPQFELLNELGNPAKIRGE